jgi:aminoglycoside 2'-N-acetyltransferase I
MIMNNLQETMKTEILSTADIPDALAETIRQWLRQIFGPDVDSFNFAEPAWRVLVWQGDRLAAHVDITERTAYVEGKPVRLGGIGGVATWPEWRGQGLATAALLQAAAFLYHSLAVDFGLLMCDPALAPFYQRLGWQTVPGPLVFEQSGQEVIMDGGTIMVLPGRERDWPPGRIDLCGPPW